MKILIAYATKNGCTEKCAKLLASKLDNTVLLNLDSQEKINLSEFDVAVIGGCIRVGHLHKLAKKFVNDNLEALLKMKTALFICCGFPESSQQYFEMNFPRELIDSTLETVCFGGELNIDTLKGFDKFLTKMIMKATEKENKKLPEINYESIDNLAQAIKEF